MEKQLKDICCYLLKHKNISNINIHNILYFIQALHLLRYENVAFKTRILPGGVSFFIRDVNDGMKYGEVYAKENVILDTGIKECVDEVIRVFKDWNHCQISAKILEYDTFNEVCRIYTSDCTVHPNRIYEYHKGRKDVGLSAF